MQNNRPGLAVSPPQQLLIGETKQSSRAGLGRESSALVASAHVYRIGGGEGRTTRGQRAGDQTAEEGHVNCRSRSWHGCKRNNARSPLVPHRRDNSDDLVTGGREGHTAGHGMGIHEKNRLTGNDVSGDENRVQTACACLNGSSCQQT